MYVYVLASWPPASYFIYAESAYSNSIILYAICIVLHMVRSIIMSKNHATRNVHTMNIIITPQVLTV